MFTTVEATRGASVLDRLDAVLDELLELELSSGTDDDVLDLLLGLEERSRRFEAVDHRVVGEVEGRGLAQQRACRSTADLLTQLLRVTPREASARVRAATQLAPRHTLSGAPAPAAFPATAAAGAAGLISAEHAAHITSCLTKLPEPVLDERFDEIEAFLVEQAAQFAPDYLARITHRLIDTYDQDGKLRDAAYRRRHRDLSVHQRPDGSSSGRFEFTAEATEALLTIIDALAAPKPGTDGGGEAPPDPRTPGQRRHDAFLDAMLLALRAGGLPTANGVTTTILLTMTAEQALTGTGLTRTGHGATIPTEDALRMATDARIVPIVFDRAGRVESYGSTQRFFTEGQRLAMTARDLGCSFPGCTVPPLQCEAHHVTPFVLSRRTTIDDGTLLCGYHHREFERLGWRCRMLDGVPHWTAPRWIDNTQTPRRNHAHSPG
jgi:hypothetical protein